MNNRLLIALPLAAVLAIPALAQTTSSDQSQSTAAVDLIDCQCDRQSTSGTSVS